MRALLFVCAAVLLAACQTSQPKPAVLDAAVVVTPPAAGVPVELAAFSGVWSGTWGQSLDGKLAVLTVAADGAVTGLYAVGEAPGFFDAQSFGVTGQIVDGTLTFKLNTGIYARYRLQPDGTLAGEYTRFGTVTTGTFARVAV